MHYQQVNVMKTKSNSNIYTQFLDQEQSKNQSEKGLTLVEAVVSMLIFFIALGSIVPISLNYSLAAIRNEQKTGAIAISQQILDEVRQFDIRTLPSGNTTVTTLPSGDPLPHSVMGRDYSPQITYCETANANYCKPDSRHIKVEVFRDGQSIYEVDTVFTYFEEE